MPQSLTKGVRAPAQAGRFYESDPAELRARLQEMLGPAAAAQGPAPMVLIAPHAGYIYSGRIAAAAYRELVGRSVDRVVILGPSHYEELTGAALSPWDAWRTPLGDLPVDTNAVEQLLTEPDFSISEAAHQPEHSIEVHLPFLQVALAGPFAIVPVLFGKPPSAGLSHISESLGRLVEAWERQSLRWIVVASSDTYHGYDGQSCRENDERLSRLFEAFDPVALQKAFQQRDVMACGWVPIVVATLMAHGRHANRARAIQRADSRAVTGEHSGYVVGYFAGAIE